MFLISLTYSRSSFFLNLRYCKLSSEIKRGRGDRNSLNNIFIYSLSDIEAKCGDKFRNTQCLKNSVKRRTKSSYERNIFKLGSQVQGWTGSILLHNSYLNIFFSFPCIKLKSPIFSSSILERPCTFKILIYELFLENVSQI